MPLKEKLTCHVCQTDLLDFNDWLELNYDNLLERTYECPNPWCTVQKIVITKK